ncbi:MAG: FAD-dependent oxidoreductase [Acutalibacteraceae bacterium]|nr:FAD-dependent oxidoreductase [Acutalibacteraceae bacterium]
MKNIKTEDLYDVIIIGGGPAGLTAALYLARAKYRVLILEKEQFGGQITITNEVVNYPGIEKISGKKLTETMRQQSVSFGAECMLAEAQRIEIKDDIKTVYTNRGEYNCLGILIATGAHPKTIGFKGEEEHKGQGVAYCATCDGEFFTDKEIFVVGGGFAAAEESVFLTKFAKQVKILIRGDDFTCAASVADKAKNHKKISVIANTVVEEVSGENGLNYIRYKNTQTGKTTEYRAENGDFFGVFVFAGYTPDTELVRDILELNEHGYIITDSEQKTSVDGIYAAGDVCIKPLRQIVTATGDGALAATELEKYIAAIQQKTGLIAKQPTINQQNNTDNILSESSDETFTPDMKNQLKNVFDKMQHNLLLKLYLDNRPVSSELEDFIKNLTALTDKIKLKVENNINNDAPCIRIFREDKTDTGIAFHGIPSGHEFTSFILGLYNASGEGQKIDEEVYKEIKAINYPTDMKILVSLSCTMCPDLVIACQRIATLNKNIRAEVYDIHHFDDLKKKYNVMSVPCLIINDENVSFGKKNINQVLELIKST